MPLANCARCKKIFNKEGPAICSECAPKEQEDYARIRDVVDREPNLTAEAAAEKAQVDVSVVNRMVNQGLVTRVGVNDKAYCGKCGAPAISLSKRLCQGCLDRLNLDVAEAKRSIQEDMAPPEGSQSLGPPKMNIRRKIEERQRR